MEVRTFSWEKLTKEQRNRLAFLFFRLHRISLADLERLGFYPGVVRFKRTKTKWFGVVIRTWADGSETSNRLEFVGPVSRWRWWNGKPGFVVMGTSDAQRNGRTYVLSNDTLRGLYAYGLLQTKFDEDLVVVSVPVTATAESVISLPFLSRAHRVVLAFDEHLGTEREQERVRRVADRLTDFHKEVISVWDVVQFEPDQDIRSRWFAENGPVAISFEERTVQTEDFCVDVIDEVAHVWAISENGRKALKQGDLSFLSNVFPFFELRGVPCRRYWVLWPD